jgi:hypothetical protein
MLSNEIKKDGYCIAIIQIAALTDSAMVSRVVMMGDFNRSLGGSCAAEIMTHTNLK